MNSLIPTSRLFMDRVWRLQRLFTAAALLAGVSSAQITSIVKITYAPNIAASLGVKVLTAADQNFAAALDSIVQNPKSRLPQNISTVAPYMLIIENNSQQAISRLEIRHDITFTNRSPVVWMQ